MFFHICNNFFRFVFVFVIGTFFKWTCFPAFKMSNIYNIIFIQCLIYIIYRYFYISRVSTLRACTGAVIYSAYKNTCKIFFKKIITLLLKFRIYSKVQIIPRHRIFSFINWNNAACTWIYAKYLLTFFSFKLILIYTFESRYSNLVINRIICFFIFFIYCIKFFRRYCSRIS